MKIVTITCRGCDTRVDVECAHSGPSFGEARSIGWGRVWDMSNGCESVWLCPTCASRVTKLAHEIFAIIRIEATHFPGLLRPTGRAP